MKKVKEEVMHKSIEWTKGLGDEYKQETNNISFTNQATSTDDIETNDNTRNREFEEKLHKRRASELPKQYLGYNQFDVSNIKDQYKFKTRNTKGKPFTSKRLSKISNALELFTNQEFASKTIDHEIMNEQIFPVNEDGLRKSIIESSIHDSFDNSFIGEKIKRNRIFSEPTSPTNRNIDDHYIRSYNVDKSIGNWNVISPFDDKNVMSNKNPSKLIKIKRLTNKERRLLRAAFPSAKENRRYKFHKVFDTKEQIMERYSKLAESYIGNREYITTANIEAK